MRSASKRGFAASLMAAVCVTAVSACAHVDVNSPQIRGIGYVRLDDIVKNHPLYTQLSQLDDAISAIQLAAAGPHVPKSAAELAQETKTLNRELKDAQDRAQKVIAQKQNDYGRKEQAAIAAALAAAGEGNAGAAAGSQMNATSAQQAQAAARAAGQQFRQYQQSVMQQGSAAAQSVSKNLQIEASRKLQARAEQAQQRESTLSLQLSQEDAPQRLALKTKLNNLALDDATRASVKSQLAALDKREADAVGLQRQRDQADLQSYQKQLTTDTNVQIRTQVGKIQSQTQANLEARRNQVTSQLRSLSGPSIPANLSPATQAKINAIHQQFQQQYATDIQRTVDEYNATKQDLDRQFAALHGADVGATGAAAKQLNDLQKRRSDLYDKIVAQIKSETQRIARDRGLRVVFDNITAAAGGYDMTDEVRKDIEGMHE